MSGEGVWGQLPLSSSFPHFSLPLHPIEKLGFFQQQLLRESEGRGHVCVRMGGGWYGMGVARRERGLWGPQELRDSTSTYLTLGHRGGPATASVLASGALTCVSHPHWAVPWNLKLPF